MTTSVRVLTLAVTAALAAVAGLAFVPLVEARVLLVVPFAAVLPTVSVAFARRRGSVLVALAGWLAAGLPLALAFGAGPSSVPQVVRGGLVDGFRMALTEALPLPATPAVLFWVFTLVWWAAYWAARAADPRVTPPLALLPPGLVLLVGIGFGASQPGRGLPVAALFAGLAALLLAARGGRGFGRMLVAAVTCAAIVLGALTAAAWLPYEGKRPVFDPRALVHPPERLERQLSPLAYASLWAAEPPRRLLTLTTTSPVNQRLAVFDHYDGLDWSSGASFLPVGSRLPAGGRPGRPVRESVAVDDLPLAWLPAPDRPTDVTGTLVRVERAAGTLTTAGGHAAAGLRYTVTSTVPRLTAQEAAAATPEYGTAYDDALNVRADVPSAILADADRLTQSAGSPYQRLLTLQDRLRTQDRYDVRAAPGRTVGHLHFFYDKSHRGTADQFATVFALMARHLGFPSRIAVGFTPGHPVGGGRYEVTTNDVVVWPEVALHGIGWVPFYPVPRPGGGGATVGRSVGEPPDRAALDQTVAARGPAAAPTPSPSGQPASTTSGEAAYRWWPAAVLLLLLLLAGYFLPGPAARAVVRQRRQSGTPYEQVVGAWQETVDALARLPGTGDLTASTAEEVAERARGWLGNDAGAHMESLARHLSASVFSGRPANEVDAAAAWLIVARVRARVDQRITRAQRIREFLRPPWAAVRRSPPTVPTRPPVRETT